MICFFFRTMISHALDGDRPLPHRVRRHVDSCPSCAAFLRAGRSLHDRLKNDPPPERLPQPDALVARVMAAISRREYRESKPVTPLWKRRRAAALAACLIVAVLAGFFSIDSGSGRTPTKEEISAGVNAVFDLGKKLLGNDQAAGGKTPCLANVTRPFTVEVDRLTENVESVKGFFLAFLPVERLNTDRVAK